MAGLASEVEVVRDPRGVPHIFAGSDDDAYFALGFVHAQDRLFQIELNRHLGQGRLAELFGEPALEIDRLFRTMDFHGTSRRMLARARPEVQRAAAAYARGVNAGVSALDGRLPPEFVLLGQGFEPARADDFVGLLAYMAWQLNESWTFDPLYEQLLARLGETRARALFPYNDGGEPAVHPAHVRPAEANVPQREAAVRWHGALTPRPLPPAAQSLLSLLPALSASNNWVIAPARSRSGQALLANDPHLPHGLPALWYQAHLHTPEQDVIGVTLPGLPFVMIGHNRHLAWGLTNVMQDAGDFFVERLDPDRPGLVQHRGEWVPLESRDETIRIKGQEAVELRVLQTPHGPLVNELRPELEQGLAYRWTLHAATHCNEIDGFWQLNRARNWEQFRAALSVFGAVAQNVAYADALGHIGMQTTGAFPRLAGKTDGSRYRVGWDGSEEWEGFIPFEQNPVTFDPAEGWLASANNPTTPAPGPFYISSQWEPMDRILRIREQLGEREQLSVDDMKRLQQDTVWVTARELTPLLLRAFEQEPPAASRLREALSLLADWNGDMRAELAAPSLFAAFYRALFYELFEDELGAELARAYRSRANVSAIMMRAALDDETGPWWDGTDTAGQEDRNAVLRTAFSRGVAELHDRLGGAPRSWTWGRLHTLTFVHPFGRASALLGAYFNRGPFAVSGANATVNKAEYAETDYQVTKGPSMRQITDFADLDAALSVIPGGQSGIPASRHYDDLSGLWLRGEYHPLPLSRDAVTAKAVLRLVPSPASQPVK